MLTSDLASILKNTRGHIAVLSRAASVPSVRKRRFNDTLLQCTSQPNCSIAPSRTASTLWVVLEKASNERTPSASISGLKPIFSVLDRYLCLFKERRCPSTSLPSSSPRLRQRSEDSPGTRSAGQEVQEERPERLQICHPWAIRPECLQSYPTNGCG